MTQFRPVFAFVALSLSLAALSCRTLQTQEERLAPRRSTEEIRFDDIRQQVSQNPVMAIDLIGSYREAYRAFDDADTAGQLAELEAQALENLRGLVEQAVGEQRWDDAASYSRSLANIEARGHEAELGFILAGAKKKLADGNVLGAFLAAVQVHDQRPLSLADAMFFLEQAVQLKQRRAAAYFCAAAEQAGGVRAVPAAMREFAQGTDSVADMIKGVATVIVDRGIRIERGRGYSDRVLGSAFFVDPTGLLITNYHVIASEVDPKYEGYSRMYIRMGDSTSPPYPARVIGWDQALDLALIKTEHTAEFVFSVVDRVVPRVGDTVLAIGSPGGLEKTVTSGIVSALSRRFLQIGDVIQIDAAVNPGNSGGPVVDSSGRLVGIVFAGAERYQGLNFAVPAQRLAAALPAMLAGGKAERPWLGMAISETLAGAEIIYTAPNTPASRHHVEEGSVIASLNGREITAPQSLLIPALQDAIFHSRPGELVALETRESDGQVRRRVVMTAPRPELPLREAARVDSRERLVAPLFGLILSPIQGRTRSSTYQVRKIVRGSIADEAGISDQDPVYIRALRILEKEGYALMEIDVKKRSMGFMETTMQLPASLDSPDTL
jgi:S1-C subfamily serine protease